MSTPELKIESEVAAELEPDNQPQLAVLRNQELVSEIFSHLGPERGPLYRLAGICKAFREPALDRLWKSMDNLLPLIKVIPGAAIDNGNVLIFQDVPSAKLTNQFKAYARRIQHLHIGIWCAFISAQAYTIMAKQLLLCAPSSEKAESLLPNLLSISIAGNIHEPSFLACFDLLTSNSRLQRVEMDPSASIRPNPNATFGPAMVTQLAQETPTTLTRLVLTDYILASLETAGVYGSLKKLIALSSLTLVCCLPFRLPSLSSLVAVAPRLQFLEIRGNCLAESTPMKPIPTVSLTSMSLATPGTYAHIIANLLLPSLQSLSLSVLENDAGEPIYFEVERLAEALATTAPKLRNLHLVANWDAVSFAQLIPLVQLPNLEQLIMKMHIPGSWIIRNPNRWEDVAETTAQFLQFLTAISSNGAEGKASALRVCCFPHFKTFMVSLDGLRYLSGIKTRLETVHLSIDSSMSERGLDPDLKATVTSHTNATSIRHLQIDDARPNSVPTRMLRSLALYIHKLFPELVTLGTVRMSPVADMQESWALIDQLRRDYQELGV
ncbi:hypothetical protein CC2G_012991 [Coprinopsis cinerea AmutBmut pab1-1]|nr:hypothetical protein CC2G_012991 [Coprinopsis cinerea AmutBmut pab1-1]